ncbi:MAG: HAD family hydrolase [Akkermansiaceae bacterium]|nr:HAD family hydrolase [Akkermansiaceae bacterium]
MLKGVIFDMDGTLGDTVALCVEAYRQTTLEVSGRLPEAGEVLGLFGISDRGVLGGLLGMRYDAPELPVEHFVKVYERLHDNLAPAPYEGAVQVLKNIRDKGLKVGLLTGKEHYTADPTIKRYGMEGLFDLILTGQPTHNCKDECLQEAMATWGMSADEIIYVGDAPTDIDHCHRVGVRIINAAWGSHAAAEEAACLARNPDYRLTDFSKLEPLITQLMI